MVATLALDPPADVKLPEPPLLLQVPFEPSPSLEPMRSSSPLAELHQRWAALSVGDSSTQGPAGGIWRRPRALLAKLVPPGAERELVGALIRSSDALAARTDELDRRLSTVEAALEEMLVVVSQELVQIQASLSASRLNSADERETD